MDHRHDSAFKLKKKSELFLCYKLVRALEFTCRRLELFDIVGEHLLVCVIPPPVLVVTVPAWGHRSRGLQGHSRLLHRLTDGEEGD